MNASKRYRRRRSWRGVVTTLAAIVVFCTTYALILPAITMEKSATCGVEEHTHGEDCYAAQVNLTCTVAELYVHTHDESCRLESGELLCTLAEVQAHTHTDECYTVESTVHEHGTDCYTPEKGDLTCVREESQGHAHGPECREEQTRLVCEIPESEAHAHGEGCRDVEGNLICILEETEGHAHGEGCSVTESVLVCQTEEAEGHAHTDECYAWTDRLTCEVSTGETILLEPVLTCGLTEIMLHTHGDECHGEDGSLTCTQPEIAEHVHSEACLTAGETVQTCTQEEHTHHEVLCYIDNTADVETEEQWKATLPGKLSGIWAEDLLAAAESQLGYAESQYNVQVDAEGNIRGYTRYGAWYGEPYSDWNSIFVSFCLNYAGIDWEAFAYESNAERWVTVLSAREQFAAAEYTPVPGDLVFMDLDDNGYADTVAIVESLIDNCLTVIQGDTENASVEKIEYLLSETAVETEQRLLLPGDILGYGILPENPNPDGTEETTEAVETTEATEPETVYYCGQEAHTHDDSCQDEEGNVTCEKAEHVHTAECEVVPEDGYFCGDSEHEHTILCKANLTDLSEEDRAMVASVILRIDAMPSADEIDAKIEEFEEAEDYEGEEAWLTEVYQQVGDVYLDYQVIHQELKAYIVNADKLLDLKYIWSAQLLIDDITSNPPTPISSASTAEFIELNLYDYNSEINTNYNSNKAWPGFQWNGGAYVPGATSANTSAKTYNRHAIDFIDFGNSLITDNTYGGNTYSFSGNSISKNRWNIGNQGGNINAIVEYPDDDYANKPVGMSNGTEVLGRNLSLAGYPWVTDAGSMVDYFSNSSFATKMNTTTIDGLFQKDEESGAYYYNSRTNHAQYGNNRFTLYNEIITPNFITYPFGNFLPLNDITNSSNATQVGAIGYGLMGDYVQETINDLLVGTVDATEQQLVDMLAKYRASLRETSTTNGTAWTTWSAKNAIYDYIGNGPTDDTGPITDALLKKMYNIDWDVKTNFFFGMEMKMNFYQPKGGMTGKDKNGDGEFDYPMEFYFTGDDDVWVYIDGVLFLDLSGIHRHVGGKIDFVNGKVHYYALSPATGDVSTTAYATYTFAELLTAAGKSTDGLNANGTFKDYTTHSFNFYYMERGSGSSVCRLNFNFPLLRQNTLSVEKVLADDDSTAAVEALGNPDFLFQVLDADDGSLFLPDGWAYSLYDTDGTLLQEIVVNEKYPDGRVKSMDIKDANGTVICTELYDANGNRTSRTGSAPEKVLRIGENGVFKLKAGQRAEFIGLPESWGKYYVRELMEGTVLDQYGDITVSGNAADRSTVDVGGVSYTGFTSPALDMTNGSSTFRIENKITTAKLGELHISKALQEHSGEGAGKTFNIEVTLDDEKLPVGTTYKVGNETRTVATEGIITIAAGEEAVIGNILAGSRFTVKETSESAEGYIVTYTTADGYSVEQVEGGVTGVMKISASVELVVTNSEKGAKVTIPVSKTLSKSDGTERTYTFHLVEVTDQTGTVVKTDGIQDYSLPVKITDGTVTEAFRLTYKLEENQTLPLKHYYRVTENMAAETMTNATAYVVEVTITETADGNIAAEVTTIWKDGEEYTGKTLAYTNTLVGSLELSKTVSGMDTDRGFVFSIHLEPGDSGTVLPDVYPAIFYQKDGTEVTTTVSRNADGNIVLSDFKSGVKAVICGIPIGSTWTITEESADGFLTTWTVTVGETQTSGQGTTATGDKIGIGKTEVAYVNTAMYELPETGGAGTQLYTMGGMLLMISAGALLLYSHRRRRKEDF